MTVHIHECVYILYINLSVIPFKNLKPLQDTNFPVDINTAQEIFYSCL